MKYILTSILFWVVFLPVYSMPASDAVFEKIEKIYTLNDDGSIDFRSYTKLKLLTHNAFNRLYGETFIVYNPLHQALTINQAQVTQKNGKIVKAPENAFNEVLPQFAADAPYYNHLREMVVTHAGLELDAVIELDYTLHTDSGYYAALMGDELISESSPIKVEIIIIRLPSWKNLYYKVLNFRIAPVITKTAEFTEYKFTFSDIKENSHESNQPQDNSHLPHLIFSTFSATAAQHYLAMQEVLNYKADESMKEAVANARKESSSDLHLVLKLQEMVVNNLNTYFIPFEYTGYKARNPVETWNSNGGTPFEKSLLLVTLFREARINAEPMIAIPTAIFNDTIGVLNQISDFLVQVNPRELEQMILSPVSINDQNHLYSLGRKTTLLLNVDKPYTSVNKEKFENKILLLGSFTIDDSLQLRGKANLLIGEKVNPCYNIKRDSSSVKQLIGGGLVSKDISLIQVENSSQMQSEIKYEFEKKQSAKRQTNYYFVDLPNCKKGVESWRINYLTADRVTPFEVPYVIDEGYDFTFTIPDDMKLVNPLNQVEMKTGFGEISLLISQNSNTITVKRKFKITQRLIPVNEYKAFKQMIDLWNDKNYREFILKTTG